METPDNFVFQQAVESSGFSDQSPFVKRDLLYIQDNNSSGIYTSNSVTFDASVMSNNGRLMAWKEGKILIPCVMVVTRKDAAGAFGVDPAGHSDFLLALKNCNTSLLHSYSIDFGNSNVVTNTQHINMYHAFKYHTELDGDEEELIGSEIGYAKDTPDSWSYRAALSSSGVGMCNNANGYAGLGKSAASCADGTILNSGMLKRQENAWKRCFPNVSAGAVDGKSLVLGNNETTHFRNPGINYVVSYADYKVYYYTAVIRLKDLQFFSSPDFPKLIRNAYFKLTLTINQPFFEVSKNLGGLLGYDPSKLQLTSGGANPVLFAASVVQSRQATAASVGDSTSADKFTACGSACLAGSATAVYQVSLSVVKPIFTHTSNNAVVNVQGHVLTSCRLYVPAYTLQAQKEAELLAVRQRQVKYTDVIPYTIYNVAGSFSNIITSGVSRAKRLIVVPVMSETANFFEGGALNAFAENQSPFSTSPSTTSPTLIQNFQCTIGGVPLYPQAINYQFENFYTEMTNTSAGGMNIDNLVVGRISMRDYVSGMYTYYVVDLKRRAVEDIDTLVSIQISGQLISSKAVHLYCFIEYERTPVVLDLATGQRLS